MMYSFVETATYLASLMGLVQVEHIVTYRIGTLVIMLVVIFFPVIIEYVIVKICNYGKVFNLPDSRCI